MNEIARREPDEVEGIQVGNHMLLFGEERTLEKFRKRYELDCVDIGRDLTMLTSVALGATSLAKQGSQQWVQLTPQSLKLLEGSNLNLMAGTGPNTFRGLLTNNNGKIAHQLEFIRGGTYGLMNPAALMNVGMIAGLIGICLQMRKLESGIQGLKGEIKNLERKLDNSVISKLDGLEAAFVEVDDRIFHGQSLLPEDWRPCENALTVIGEVEGYLHRELKSNFDKGDFGQINFSFHYLVKCRHLRLCYRFVRTYWDHQNSCYDGHEVQQQAKNSTAKVNDRTQKEVEALMDRLRDEVESLNGDNAKIFNYKSRSRVVTSWNNIAVLIDHYASYLDLQRYEERFEVLPNGELLSRRVKNTTAKTGQALSTSKDKVISAGQTVANNAKEVGGRVASAPKKLRKHSKNEQKELEAQTGFQTKATPPPSSPSTGK